MRKIKCFILLFIINIFLLGFDKTIAQNDTISYIPELIPYRKGDLWGYCNKEKKIIIPIKYQEAEPFNDSIAIVKFDDKYGLINKNGGNITPFKYNVIRDFQGGMAAVCVRYKGIIWFSEWGYINKNGEEIIRPEYTEVEDFKNGFAKVFYKTKNYLINSKGKKIIDTHLIISELSEGFMVIKSQMGRHSYIDSTGHFIKYLKNSQTEYLFPESYIPSRDNRTAKISYSLIKDAHKFSQGLAAIMLHNEWYYVNKQLEIIIKLPVNCDFTSYFCEDRALIAIKDINSKYKYGFIDLEGNEIIKCKYEYANEFKNGVAIVKLDGKYGFINKDGEEIIPLIYDNALDFEESFALVCFNYKWGYINNKGEEIIPCKFDGASEFCNGIARIKLNGKVGYIDELGKVIILNKYDEGLNYYNGLIKVKYNSKWGFIDRNGNEYWEN